MRPQTVSLAALGFSQWLNTNWLQNAFAVSLAGIPSSDGNLTWKVQHTFDLFSQDPRPVSISRTTTTATVTDVDHRLSTGDNIMVTASGSTNLDTPAKGAEVTVTGVDTYTYVVANTGATAAVAKVKSFRVFDHATLVAKTARADGNYAFPPEACRLVITAYTAGKCDLIVHQGLGT